MRTLRTTLVAMLLCGIAMPVAAQATGTVKVSSSYNGRTFCGATLRATLLLLVPSGGGAPVEFRTDLTGKATVKAPAGDYELVVADTMQVSGGCLTWRVPVRVEAGRTLELPLTNANATTLRPVTDTTSGDSALIAGHRARWTPALVTVNAGMRTATGLLVDASGLVLTSAWGVAADTVVVVDVDSTTRLRARVVTRDDGLGVAAVLVAPSAVGARQVATLSRAPAPEPRSYVTVVYRHPAGSAAYWTPVEAASPAALRLDLPQPERVTGAVAVTPDGELAALITALPRPTCAPPVPNAVPIARVMPFVELARARAASLPPPDTTRLPAWPTERFTRAMLDSIADAAPLDRYEGLDGLKAGHFRVRLETPPLLLVEQRAMDAQRRKYLEKWTKDAKGEEKACWTRVERPPERRRATSADYAVLEIHVDAELSYTGGGKLYGITVAKPFIRMEGDLGPVVIYRNGEAVVPIAGGTDWRTHRLFTPKGEWADSAHVGWYALDASVLAPDENGAPPSIAMYLPDFRHPGEPSCLELKAEHVALLWNDVLPVYARATPSPVRADAKAKPLSPRPAPGQGCVPPRSIRPF